MGKLLRYAHVIRDDSTWFLNILDNEVDTTVDKFEILNFLSTQVASDGDLCKVMSSTKSAMANANTADKMWTGFMRDFAVSYTTQAVLCKSTGQELARALN